MGPVCRTLPTGGKLGDVSERDGSEEGGLGGASLDSKLGLQSDIASLWRDGQAEGLPERCGWQRGLSRYMGTELGAWGLSGVRFLMREGRSA